MFETFLTQPLYNGFIYLIGIMPGGDVGLAIIVLTLIVRFAFYPAFASSIRTQMGMQAVQGDLDLINEKYKDKKEERAKLTMELFKKNKVNPLASIVALLIQLPIIFALYFAFFQTELPEINTALLYRFVPVPPVVNIHFLNFVDLTLAHNIILSLVVGGLQYLVIHFSLARTKNGGSKTLSSEKLAAQKMQHKMMLYMMPALIVGMSYSLPAAVGVYFAAGSVISLGQEWLIRRQMAQKAIVTQHKT